MTLRDDILTRRRAREKAKREESLFFAKWATAVDVLFDTIQKDFSDLIAEGLLEARRLRIHKSSEVTLGVNYEIGKLELLEPEGFTLVFLPSGHDVLACRGYLTVQGSGSMLLEWSERYETERHEKEKDANRIALAWSANCSSWRIAEWSNEASGWRGEKHLVRANLEPMLQELLNSK